LVVHPWHGLEVGRKPPEHVNAHIEITPYDLIKYEVDKSTGYLRVDRPQPTFSHPPALYGFIPRTYCGTRVEALFPGADRGDGDPLDICVISERPISRSEVIVPACILGGIQLLDRGEADDKVIVVLEGDHVWRNAADLEDLPPILVERLQHYFATYKLVPGAENQISVRGVCGRGHALVVVEAAIEDYKDLLLRPRDRSGPPEKRLETGGPGRSLWGRGALGTIPLRSSLTPPARPTCTWQEPGAGRRTTARPRSVNTSTGLAFGRHSTSSHMRADVLMSPAGGSVVPM
jgi:inorganic pyrophosphatase